MRNYTGLAFAAGFFFTGIGIASAADLPLKARPMVPPPVVASWTGWYIGGNVGGAWSESSTAGFSGGPGTAGFFAANEFPTSLGLKPSGVIGGAQIGYNWQMSPQWVFGLEADIQGSSYKGSSTVTPVPVFFVPFTTTVEQHSNWFGTFRGRVGFLATPSLLLYGTGGLAYGETETSFSTIATGFTLATCPANFTCVAAGRTSTRAGWTAGAGFEWMAAPQWSFKAEYLFVDLGTQSVTGATTSAFFVPPVTFTASTPFRENIVRVGVNYHFGGPIVAKY
jgi:outer membrane immunogenic protein